MPVHEEETIGMGMPSALRKRMLQISQENEAKEKDAHASSIMDRTIPTQREHKTPACLPINDATMMSDAVRILQNEDVDKPEETPSDTVQDPTFKVTLKTANLEESKEEPPTGDTHIQDLPISFDEKVKVCELNGFSFSVLPAAKFPGFHAKETRKLFEKWGINYHISKYRFHEPFEPERCDTFLREFMECKAFQENARRATGKGHRRPLQRIQGKITKVIAEKLNLTVTNLGFFDRLEDEGIQTSSGKIKGCFESQVDGVQCNNLLKKALLDEDDENYDAFDDDDRNELIFKLLRHIVFGGGSLCQYEDQIKPYLDTCKMLYKDLISVCRNSTTGKIDIRSFAYNIKEVNGLALFPLEHELNVCFVCVDTIRKFVTFYYAAWPGSSW